MGHSLWTRGADVDWMRVSGDTGGTQLYSGPGQAAHMWEVMEGHFGVNPSELSDGVGMGAQEERVSR